MAVMCGSFSTWVRCCACSPAWAGRRSSPGFGGRRRPASTPWLATLWLLAAIAVGISVRDFLKPYKDPCFQRDRDFARWFWTEKSRDGELVCLKHDFGGRCFYHPAEGDDLASIFYCNQRIYWPRLARGEKPQWDNISKTWPLRCVRFRPSITTRQDEEEFSSLAESDDFGPQAGVGRAGDVSDLVLGRRRVRLRRRGGGLRVRAAWHSLRQCFGGPENERRSQIDSADSAAFRVGLATRIRPRPALAQSRYPSGRVRAISIGANGPPQEPELPVKIQRPHGGNKVDEHPPSQPGLDRAIV